MSIFDRIILTLYTIIMGVVAVLTIIEIGRAHV